MASRAAMWWVTNEQSLFLLPKHALHINSRKFLSFHFKSLQLSSIYADSLQAVPGGGRMMTAPYGRLKGSLWAAMRWRLSVRHTTLLWSLQLSNVGPSQFLNGWPGIFRRSTRQEKRPPSAVHTSQRHPNGRRHASRHGRQLARGRWHIRWHGRRHIRWHGRRHSRPNALVRSSL
jgi:hypothetical protein